MRIITRTILFELMKVTLLTLVGLTTLIILVLVAREAVQQGLGPLSILKLIPYVLPEAMRFTVPGAVLLAVTSVYGRMAADNEFVALKALGISPLRTMGPMLLLAIFFSFSTLWLTDIAMSWGRIGMQRIILDSIEEVVYSQLRTRRTFVTKGVSITVQSVQERRLIGPTLIFRSNSSRSAVTVTADEAELKTNPLEGTITLKLRRPTGLRSDFQYLSPNEESYVIALDDFLPGKKRRVKTSDAPLSRISSLTKAQQKKIQLAKKELAALASYFVCTGDYSGLSSPSFQHKTILLERSKKVLSHLRAEPYRRWANGFCCLAFALVGAPMAILKRQREFLASFFACFLPILALFYPMLFLGIEWAKNGSAPPIIVWTGNVVFALWGVRLLRRVVRY